MASKGAFAGVFPDVPGKMLASAEDHSTVAIASALEGLRRGRSVAFVDADGVCGGRDERGGNEGSSHGGGGGPVFV